MFGALARASPALLQSHGPAKKFLCAQSGHKNKSLLALRRAAEYLNYRLRLPFVLRFSKHERIFLTTSASAVEFFFWINPSE
jgi:hypothetical protein